MINVYEQVDANRRKSAIVMVAFISFISLAVYILSRSLGGDLTAAAIALIVTGLLSFVSYYSSDKIILTISGAKPANKKDHFNFYTVAENLSIVAQIPIPKLYVIEDTAMNAFATGRDPDHAVICATTGLLSRLDRTELEGVIAHEISHIGNYDIRLMSIVTVLVGMVTLLADWLLRTRRIGGNRKKEGGQIQLILFVSGILLALLAPIIAQLIQLAISRRREFMADSSGVLLTRYPEGLARALEKINLDKEPLEAANKATAHLYISNPLKNRHDGIGWFAGLFNTHPPISLRINALRQTDSIKV